MRLVKVQEPGSGEVLFSCFCRFLTDAGVWMRGVRAEQMQPSNQFVKKKKRNQAHRRPHLPPPTVPQYRPPILHHPYPRAAPPYPSIVPLYRTTITRQTCTSCVSVQERQPGNSYNMTVVVAVDVVFKTQST